MWAGHVVSTLRHTTTMPLARSDEAGWFRDNWQKIREALGTPAGAARPAVPPSSPAAAAAGAVVAAGMLRARHDAYRYLDGQLGPAGSCARAATALQGATMLLENAVRLLLPDPRLRDDLIVALFDGPPRTAGGVRLPDHRLSLQAATRDLEQRLAGGGPRPGPGDWVKGSAGDSAQRLLARLLAWQKQVRAGSFDNPQAEVAGSLLRQQTADVVVRSIRATALTDPPEPPGPDGFVVARGTFTTVAGAVARTEPARSLAPGSRLKKGHAYLVEGYTDRGERVADSARWFLLAEAPGGWVHSSGGRFTGPT